MSGLIDDKDKNRFTRQLEIQASATKVLYFTLSASDGSGGHDIYGDIQILSFVNVNCASACVGSKYESGSFYLSADGVVYSNDIGQYGTVVHENGSSLTTIVDGYGLAGIMEIKFRNEDSVNDITVVANIEFQNIVDGAMMTEVTNPPPLP